MSGTRFKLKSILFPPSDAYDLQEHIQCDGKNITSLQVAKHQTSTSSFADSISYFLTKYFVSNTVVPSILLSFGCNRQDSKIRKSRLM